MAIGGPQELKPLHSALERVIGRACDHTRCVTDAGKGIDDHQVHCERVSYLATELRAAQALAAYAAADGNRDPMAGEVAAVFAARAAARFRSEASARPEAFGFTDSFLAETLDAPEVKRLMRAGLADERLEAIGRHVLATRGENESWLEHETDRLARESVRIAGTRAGKLHNS